MADNDNNIQYSDIDPEWESSFILMFLSKDHLKNKKEISYLTRYQTLYSNYCKFISEPKAEFFEKELAKLENTKVIKKIVAREGPADFILEMTFAKTTLNPNHIKTDIKEKKYYTLSGVIGLILGILYLVGMADLDYGYYTFLRIVSFLAIPIFLYSYWHIHENEDIMKIDVTHIITGIVWVLFNPILPIHLSKDLWMFFDFISAMIFFALDIYLIVLYRREKIAHQESIQQMESKDEEDFLADGEVAKAFMEFLKR